ncbi:hypothetical protein SAMN05444147_11635 [Pectobacterium carotovorum]|nr:hypothetical protein SAMN05444147_11635 [Pectobacterium carotovorum]
MMSYILANGKEVTSEVLLKLEAKHLPALPMACKVCTVGKWQIFGTVEKPNVRCFCPLMHVFSWDSQKPSEEILDCDMLYEPEEDEVPPVTTQSEHPQFLAVRQQPITKDGQESSNEMDKDEEHWQET